jgi:tripartite-type tricarboxylate transporter receptor subunit TctC
MKIERTTMTPCFHYRFRQVRRVAAAVAVAVAAIVLAPSVPRAEDYPARTVKIVVPFPAGGTADVMPRVVGDWLSRKWGHSVIIENKTGAAGNIGAESVANATPDGYTLLSAPPPPLVINQNLYPKLGFDPLKFVPIVIIGRVPNALVVNPSKIKANTISEVIAAAQAAPGKITMATQGNGTTSHLTTELFQLMAKVKFQQVPYRGSAPALNDLVAGNVDAMFDNLGVSMALVKSGKLKLIAVATPKRMAALPNIPTVAETLPGFESAAWFAIVAPPTTPAAIVNKINADVNEALKDTAIQKRLADLSAEPIGGTPEATASYMHEEVERWYKVIKSANVKLQ